MNNKLEEQIKKASDSLCGEVVELLEPLPIKYTIKDKEYEYELARGFFVDRRLIEDEEFRNKYFKLFMIIEIMEAR